jgi:hypothetical protein
MPHRSYDLHGVRVFELAVEGPPLRNDRDAAGLLPTLWSQRATLLVLPVERLVDDFFQLKTCLAGEMIQKFVNYRMRVAILGDISRYLAKSSALRDFVRESNRGNQVWFVASLEELERRLEASQATEKRE